MKKLENIRPWSNADGLKAQNEPIRMQQLKKNPQWNVARPYSQSEYGSDYTRLEDSWKTSVNIYHYGLPVMARC